MGYNLNVHFQGQRVKQHTEEDNMELRNFLFSFQLNAHMLHTYIYHLLPPEDGLTNTETRKGGNR